MEVSVAMATAQESGTANFSDDRNYRYTLTRVWDSNLPIVSWIGLNPSTADEQKLDPTLRRVLRFSHGFGFGGFHMLNLFSYRTKDPMVMRAVTDPVGPENDEWIRRMARDSHEVIAAWGAHGTFMHRHDAVLSLLEYEGIRVSCLGQTLGGMPKHPLYLASSTHREVISR